MGKKLILTLVCILSLTVANASAREKEVVKMGVEYGRDSSAHSHRVFPKRLFVAKGAWAVGLQGTYINMNSTNSEFLLLLTGATGGITFARVAPYVAYAYAPNAEVGLRFHYVDAHGKIDNAMFSLLSDDLKFEFKNVDARMQTYGGAAYNRYYFGLDDKGRLALFCDLVLAYNWSKLTTSASASNYAITNSIKASFCPGMQIFVLNNVSFMFSLGLADLGYNWSTSYRANQPSGSNSAFVAAARLNILDLMFGLSYHF